MRCARRSPVTRRSCLPFARCSPKNTTICRPFTPPCPSWPSWPSRNAMPGSPPSSVRLKFWVHAPFFDEPLGERQHDVLFVRCPLLQPLVIGLDLGQLRALHRERVPAMDERPQRNVAHGEGFACDVIAPFQALLEHLKSLTDLFRFRFYSRHVAFFRRCADKAPEDGRERRRDGARRPIHPAVGIGALDGLDDEHRRASAHARLLGPYP